MEQNICFIKGLTDFYFPEFMEKYKRHHQTPLEERALQNALYTTEKVQGIDLGLEWETESIEPYSENLWVLLDMYIDCEAELQNAITQVSPKLNRLIQAMGQWLTKNVPEGIPNYLYGFVLTYFMKTVLNSYNGNKDKIAIKAQQYCYLEEADLKTISTIIDKMTNKNAPKETFEQTPEEIEEFD